MADSNYKPDVEVTVPSSGMQDFEQDQTLDLELNDDNGEIQVLDCAVTSQHDQNVLFDIYQPHVTERNTFICKICLQVGKHEEFDDRAQFAAHRYKVHGSYNVSVICPIVQCKEVFASMIVLRKHLTIDHKLPLEVHFQIFLNISDFDRWRHVIEKHSRSRFVMFTKSQNFRRQVMHCIKSEHKMILTTKKNPIPRIRMGKEGACCPAMISFKIDEKTGHVYAYYQLEHVGHINEDIEEEYPPSQSLEENGWACRFSSMQFPQKPSYLNAHGMQFVQIDVIEMTSTVYETTIYSHILVMTDLSSGFIWAKPLGDPFDKNLIARLLTDVFAQFGVPEGFSSCVARTKEMVQEAMSVISIIFQVTVREIFYESPDYDEFRQFIVAHATEELRTPNRWVEVLTFSVMALNQSGPKSPFSRFFKRNPRAIGSKEQEIRDSPDNLAEKDSQEIIATNRFTVGDLVYLRPVDWRFSKDGATYLYGRIGEVDWESSPHFPYKVHYSSRSDVWPSTDSPTVLWCSPYDLMATTRELFYIRHEDRHCGINDLLCSCRSSECMLFRSNVCDNQMSRSCCLASQRRCRFHENVNVEDGLARIELLTRYFSPRCPFEDRKRIESMVKIRGLKRRRERSDVGADSTDMDQIVTLSDSMGFPVMCMDKKVDIEEHVHFSHDTIHPGDSYQIIDEDSRNVVEVILEDPQGPDSANQSYSQQDLRKRRRNSMHYSSNSTATEELDQESRRRSSRPVKAKTYQDYIIG